jgi:D,D-heptose 1,7-bisphosphate phosphatase
MKDKVVFIDRDGTLIKERDFISDIGQVELIPGAAKALRILRQLGIKTVVVSNQSGVARGLLTESQVRLVNNHILRLLRKEGAEPDAVYYCPHHPAYGGQKYRRNCNCRKPATGMIKRAQKELSLSANSSYVIGDKLSDMELANKMKFKGILLKTGYGKQEISATGDRLVKLDFVAANLLRAVEWIAKDLKQKISVTKNAGRFGATKKV